MNRKTTIYLAVALLLVVGWLLLRTRPEPVEKMAALFQLTPQRIHRVVISAPDDTLDIRRQDGTWRMVVPVQTAVDDGQLASFFQVVLSAEIYDTPVAESPESHPLYAVDEQTGTRLQMYGGADSLLADLWVGSRGNRFFSAIRHHDDNRVYRVSQDLTPLLTASSETWREHDVFVVDPDDIERIEVKYSRGHYSLTWEPPVWRYRSEGGTRADVPPFDVPRDNHAFLKLVNGLTQMTSLRFVDNAWSQWEQRFQHPALEVWIGMRGGEQHHMAFVPGDLSRSFLLQMDDRTDMLYFQSADLVERFTRSAEHFGAPKPVQHP